MRETWEDEVAGIVKRRGGPMNLSDIYHEMRNQPTVTPHHLEPWQQGGQPRYECWVRRCLTTLVDKGVVERVRRGVYSAM